MSEWEWVISGMTLTEED